MPKGRGGTFRYSLNVGVGFYSCFLLVLAEIKACGFSPWGHEPTISLGPSLGLGALQRGEGRRGLVQHPSHLKNPTGFHPSCTEVPGGAVDGGRNQNPGDLALNPLGQENALGGWWRTWDVSSHHSFRTSLILKGLLGSPPWQKSSRESQLKLALESAGHPCPCGPVLPGIGSILRVSPALTASCTALKVPLQRLPAGLPCRSVTFEEDRRGTQPQGGGVPSSCPTPFRGWAGGG